MFAMRHKLLFGCLWSGNASRDCQQKEELDIGSHRLEHRVGTSYGNRALGQDSLPSNGFGVIGVGVEDAMGRLIASNIL